MQAARRSGAGEEVVELGGAIGKARTMSGPVVVDVVTDFEALAPLAVSGGGRSW